MHIICDPIHFLANQSFLDRAQTLYYHFMINCLATHRFTAIKVYILAVGLSGCVSSNYLVTTPSSYENAGQLNPPKKIIILNDEMLDGALSNEFVKLFNKRAWKLLESRITDLPEPQARHFITALTQLIQGDYPTAYQSLSSLPEQAFDCQVQILKADCQYEMRSQTASDLQRYYQQASDCAENSIVQSIANTRYRFVKYDY